MKTKFGARFSWLMVLVVLSLMVAACGGGSDNKNAAPTNTPAPMPTSASTATTVASPDTSSAASPEASPVGLAGAASSMTRDEFKAQLASHFSIEQPGATGGQIVWASPDDISTTNPLLMTDQTTANVLSQVFEGLIGVSPIDGRPVPGLADSWDLSADGLVYTFHLNTAAQWQDGVDFTADDVQFSFDAALDPNLNYANRSLVRSVVKSYRVVDADTFEVTALDQFATFLFYGPGQVTIVPKHLWESVPLNRWSFDGGSTGTDLSRVVGTGPFRLTEWKAADRVVLTRNDAYYDVVPSIDTFEMVVQPTAETYVNALKQGDVDIVEILPAADTAGFQQDPNFTVDVYSIFALTGLWLNLDGTHQPAFNDVAVRQALMMSLDRQSITDNIYAGFGEPAVGTQPPLSPSYNPSAISPDYAFDPEGAKQLLAQAGWVRNDGDDWVKKDGQELKITLSYGSGDRTVDSLAAYVQEAWKTIGVKVELNVVDGGAFLELINNKSFDVVLAAQGFFTDGSQGYVFRCDSIATGFNITSYCNQNYDALDEQQIREFDPATRDAMQGQLSQMVWTDLPVLPIRFGEARTGYSSTIHNFFPNGYGFLWSLSYVWVEQST